MTPTREQLASIEWSAEWDGPDDLSEPMCPACRNLKREGHAPDCWLAACLAAPPPEPQTMPPIEKGDVIREDGVNAPMVITTPDEAARANKYSSLIFAVYRTPVWTREPRR